MSDDDYGHQGGAAIPATPSAEESSSGGTASTPARKAAWDEFAEKLPYRVADRWSDDEIVDQAAAEIPGGATAAEQRLLGETLRQVRRRGVPELTHENVIAERERRIAAGEAYGDDSLAGVFYVSEATIRRRRRGEKS